jgi:hypothetical protein
MDEVKPKPYYKPKQNILDIHARASILILDAMNCFKQGESPQDWAEALESRLNALYWDYFMHLGQ